MGFGKCSHKKLVKLGQIVLVITLFCVPKQLSSILPNNQAMLVISPLNQSTLSITCVAVPARLPWQDLIFLGKNFVATTLVKSTNI